MAAPPDSSSLPAPPSSAGTASRTYHKSSITGYEDTACPLTLQSQYAVKARLQAFLPEIAQANEAIAARVAVGQGTLCVCVCCAPAWMVRRAGLETRHLSMAIGAVHGQTCASTRACGGTWNGPRARGASRRRRKSSPLSQQQRRKTSGSWRWCVRACMRVVHTLPHSTRLIRMTSYNTEPGAGGCRRLGGRRPRGARGGDDGYC